MYMKMYAKIINIPEEYSYYNKTVKLADVVYYTLYTYFN